MKKLIKFIVCFMIVPAIAATICFATATATVNTTLSLSGLGSSSPQLSLNFTGTTPNAAAYFYTTQTTTDVNEAIALGDVSTVEGLLIKADGNDLSVDCDFVTTFNPDVLIAEGQTAYFKPAGVVRIQNTTGTELCIYEYIIFGTK